MIIDVPTLIFYVFNVLLLTYVIKFFLFHRNLTRVVVLSVAASRNETIMKLIEKKSVTMKETM